jgi:hypothetical protein
MNKAALRHESLKAASVVIEIQDFIKAAPLFCKLNGSRDCFVENFERNVPVSFG